MQMMQAEIKPYKRIGMGFLVLAGLCLVLSFMVLLNDGQGGFSDTGRRLGRGLTHSLFLVDMDGDGCLDLFAAGDKGASVFSPPTNALTTVISRPPGPIRTVRTLAAMESILWLLTREEVQDRKMSRSLELLRSKMRDGGFWELEKNINVIVPVGRKDCANAFITERATEVLDYYGP
jgi:hypothetical protein